MESFPLIMGNLKIVKLDPTLTIAGGYNEEGNGGCC
jgi:hypothetical protein